MSQSQGASTPQFFRIIFNNTIRDNMLSIPEKFLKQCGEILSKSVYLKLPCGTQWKMGLLKLEGKVWLDKGWPEFSKHYSLARGHMLTFRYKGNSRFRVVIFDKTTVEIDYPAAVHLDEGDIDEPPPCSRPRKRMRTSNEPDEPRSNITRPKPSGNSNTPKKSKMKGKTKVVGHTKMLKRSERIAALEKASGFTSNRPFFKVVMQPYYLRSSILNFDMSFAREHLKSKSGEGILKLPNRGKIWPVRYSSASYNRRLSTRLHCGWKEFVRNNHLKIRDVCVFVLLRTRKKVSFEVVIFRDNVVTKAQEPSALRKREPLAKEEEPEESSENESEPGVDINIDNFLPTQETRPASTLRETSFASKKADRWRRTLSGFEKSRILERAPFESEKPFFHVVMQPSYVCPGWRIPVPLEFGMRDIKKERDVVLRVPNGGTLWSVKFKIWRLKCGRTLTEFSDGWQPFVKDNNLEVRDTCIFELIDETKALINVYIVRFSDDPPDPNRQRRQEFENKTSSAYSLGNTSPKPEAIARPKPLTVAEKARLLERACFESKRPFFKIVIQPTHTGAGHHLHVPSDFVQEHIKSQGGGAGGAVVLRTPNSTKTWYTELITRCPVSGPVTAVIYRGWKEFAKSNDLKLGDVAIFELVTGTEISFKVSIVRAPLGDWRNTGTIDET